MRIVEPHIFRRVPQSALGHSYINPRLPGPAQRDSKTLLTRHTPCCGPTLGRVSLHLLLHLFLSRNSADGRRSHCWRCSHGLRGRGNCWRWRDHLRYASSAAHAHVNLRSQELFLAAVGRDGSGNGRPLADLKRTRFASHPTLDPHSTLEIECSTPPREPSRWEGRASDRCWFRYSFLKSPFSVWAYA